MTEEILKDLPLMAVDYENDNTTAHLTFLIEDIGEIREIFLHKQKYNNDKQQYEPDDTQAKKIEDNCQKYFGTSFDKLDSQINTRHDVYDYGKFCSLFHIDMVTKFDMEDVGVIFDTKIKDIQDNGVALVIYYDYEDELRQTKYTYATYFEDLNKWMPNQNTKNKKLDKFKDTLGVSFEKKDELIGKDIQVEIKKAFGKYTYGEIKKLKNK